MRKSKIIRIITFQILNFVIFIFLRQLSGIVGILSGVGAGNYYKEYEDKVYLPATIFQVVILIVLFLIQFFNAEKRINLSGFNYLLGSLAVILLSFVAFLRLIPYEVITYDILANIKWILVFIGIICLILLRILPRQ